MERNRPDFITPYRDYNYLASGLRSDTFRLGESHVVKVVKESHSQGEAQALAIELKMQSDLLHEYLNPYIVPADHVVGMVNGRPSVIIIQPFIEGHPIKDSIKEELRSPSIKQFFSKCLELYEKKGLMPDIFGRPHFLRSWTAPYTSPNVKIIEDENGEPFPYLIDTNFTRRSMRKPFGKLHMRLLYEGTKRFVNNLNK